MRAIRRIQIKEEAEPDDIGEIASVENNPPVIRKSDIAPTVKAKSKKKRTDPLASFKNRELFKLNSLVFAKLATLAGVNYRNFTKWILGSFFWYRSGWACYFKWFTFVWN